MNQVNVEQSIDEIYNTSWIHMRDQYAEDTFKEHALFNTTLLEISKPEKGTLLEIGSGTGEFLYTARSAGWDVTGIEPSLQSCTYAKQKYGLDLIQGVWNKDQFEPGKKFDVIVFWHVLEHIANPITFLEELIEILEPNGLIVFSIPNKDSYTNEIKGSHSPLFTEIDHLYHYSKKSLPVLLNKVSLNVLSLFSRQTMQSMNTDLNYCKNAGRETVTTVHEKMALISQLQGEFRGHELCCIARKC